jgi:hypothetical protein
MSTIFISVGQCGNQLASSFLDYVQENQSAQTSYLFNHYDGKYHFINLDSEIKVINNLLDKHQNLLRPENVFKTKCGRGSNWASGYAGVRDGATKIFDLTMESIRFLILYVGKKFFIKKFLFFILIFIQIYFLK